MSPSWTPVFYAIAMAVSGLGSLVFGRWFDRAGLRVLIPLTLASPCSRPTLIIFAMAAQLAAIPLFAHVARLYRGRQHDDSETTDAN